ncbi:MAG: repressor LexA [Desulfobacterales bacterium CG07_land_8_20_14_0_80_52_14]|nr:MAG: repressor LexA [Desulfobacterales bacterium CG07_land_8_20_14_0_80_52_14]
MMAEFTPKQERLIDYLKGEGSRTGRTPSLRRAAEHLGVSHAAVSQMIRALEKKGALHREKRYGRTVHLLNRAGQPTGLSRFREIPVVGNIAAGLPLYAQQEWGGSLVVDADLYGGANLFALTVRGDSMKDAGILDGDLAVCEPRQFAENGEIVAVLIRQEEATIKRFFLKKKHIELRPENASHRPMICGFDEVLIQGKVIGIQRGPDVMKRV